jgi:RecB family endonuclease NucS
MTNYNIRKISNIIKFESETVLENFIWDNLVCLLKLTPLKRQYWMPGQYHDILGLSEDKLSIIELKNQQDKYVTHQITRYFHSIKEI